jgi:hypothetical protein
MLKQVEGLLDMFQKTHSNLENIYGLTLFVMKCSEFRVILDQFISFLLTSLGLQ